MATSKRAKEKRQREMQAAAKARKLQQSFDNMKLYGCAKSTTKRGTMPEYRIDDHREKYKSVDHGTINTNARSKQEYTGTFVKGIGTMHKSNAIPVVDEEFMIALSQMRRN
jgi:hypothetical protein